MRRLVSQGGLKVGRTGSPVHRFKNARPSDGGYTATSPNLLTYVIITTNTLGEINRTNHNFIYQSLLLLRQQAAIERSITMLSSKTYHFHISCKTCLRVIDDVNIEASSTYMPVKDWAEVINKMGYDFSVDTRTELMPSLREIDWSNSTSDNISYKVGFAQGAASSILKSEGSSGVFDPDLFPKTLAEKVIHRSYLKGLLCGIRVGVALDCMFKRSVNDLRRPKRAMTGATQTLLESLAFQRGPSRVLGEHGFQSRGQEEVRASIRLLSIPKERWHYFSNTLSTELLKDNFSTRKGHRLILFSDFRSPRTSVLTIVGWKAAQILSSDTVVGDHVLTLHSLKLCVTLQFEGPQHRS
jgi:hypothetical protein